MYLKNQWNIAICLSTGFLLILQSNNQLVLLILPASLDHVVYRRIEILKSVVKFFISLLFVYCFGAKPINLILGFVFSYIVVTPHLYLNVIKKSESLKIGSLNLIKS